MNKHFRQTYFGLSMLNSTYPSLFMHWLAKSSYRRPDIFLKRSIQTSVVNSHTVTYKHIASADNPAPLQFNCYGHSDCSVDLNSVCLLLRIKLVKTDGSDIESAGPNTVGCVKNLLHSMFSFLSASLNSKRVTLHEKNYHYKAYLEKLLNYGSDPSGTHVVSSLWYRLGNSKTTVVMPND